MWQQFRGVYIISRQKFCESTMNLRWYNLNGRSLPKHFHACIMHFITTKGVYNSWSSLRGEENMICNSPTWSYSKWHTICTPIEFFIPYLSISFYLLQNGLSSTLLVQTEHPTVAAYFLDINRLLFSIHGLKVILIFVIVPWFIRRCHANNTECRGTYLSRKARWYVASTLKHSIFPFLNILCVM